MTTGYRCAVLLVLLCLWVSAEDRSSVQAAPPPEAGAAYVDFQQIAVMPFFVGSRKPNIDETADNTLSCPVGVLCEEAPRFEPGTGRMLTRMVYDALRRKFPGQVVSLERSERAYARALVDEPSETPRSLARKIGRSLAADYVVVGTLWRYRGRGEAPGIPDSPASVAFALYLVKVDTGRRIWRGIFDETQRPVTENLFQARQSLKMGVRWLSAKELARFGVGRLMESFPAEQALRIPVKRDE